MRKWFPIPSLLQLIITIGIIGIILIQTSISKSNGILIELQEQISEQIHGELSQRIESAMLLNQKHNDALLDGELNLESTVERERYFTRHIKMYPDVAMTFIGLADGSFYGARRLTDGGIEVVRNNSTTNGSSLYYWTSSLGEGVELVDEFPNFDPRKRPWYTETANLGQATFSSAYSHFTFHEPTITASQPVYDKDNQLIGVLGVNYLLSSLGDILRNSPIGDLGQVFVTDDTGMLVATSLDIPTYKLTEDNPQLISVKEIDNPIIQSSLSLPIKENKKKLPKISVEGSNYYVGTSKFQENNLNWNVYVVLAEGNFFGQAKNAIIQTEIILIFSFLISILFAWWIVGRIMKPIVTLGNAAEELANGKMITIPDDGRKDEIGKLIKSFNKMSMKIVKMVAHLEMEVALRTEELEKNNDELKRLSFTDGLTGISNRRQFDIIVSSGWNTALRYKWRIGLFMMDIDLFKNYNDSYGHQAGDDCLRTIGNLMRGKVRRSTDIVARYGGEEFVIMIQDVEIDKLIEFAEEIRKSVESLNIEHSESPFKKVTMSVGVAHMVPSTETRFETLILRADQALYQAKNQDRNTVVVSKGN